MLCGRVPQRILLQLPSQRCREAIRSLIRQEAAGGTAHNTESSVDYERESAHGQNRRGSPYVSEGRLLSRVVAQRSGTTAQPGDLASARAPQSTETASALARDRVRNTPPNFVAGLQTRSATAPEVVCRSWALHVVSKHSSRSKASRAKLAPRTAPRRSVATSRTALRRAVAAPWFVAVKKLQRLRARPIAVARSAKKLRPPRREARAAERATDRGRATP